MQTPAMRSLGVQSLGANQQFPGTMSVRGTRVEELGGCQSPISHKVIALNVEISDKVLSFGR